MTIMIKDWNRFQHFRDRRPPWVKLYRDILDDIEWFELPGECAKSLVMMWLIASENDGCLPSIKELAFRLRKNKSETIQIVTKLSHWLEYDDIDLISECHQVDIPERETEAEAESERETEHCANGFNEFWFRYPKKVGKDAAKKAWQKKKPRIDDVMFALSWQINSDQWSKSDGQFIPNPATYINQGRWQDEMPQEVTF
jgi:hypothetical protein